MYCNRCGAHIPEDADFCPQCGCRVSGKAAQAQTQEGIPIRRAHRSNSVIIGAILAVAIVLIVCIICLTVVTRGNQQAQMEASKQSQSEQVQQPTQKTDSADSGAAKKSEQTEKTKASSDSQVTNNYYYYGDGAAHANDYYDEVGNNGYLWPSDTEYIVTSDLSGLNQDTVAAIRNEIYARHGYAFNSTRWQNYFSGKTWYHRDSSCTSSNIDSRLSDVERTNIATLVSYEESKGWR